MRQINILKTVFSHLTTSFIFVSIQKKKKKGFTLPKKKKKNLKEEGVLLYLFSHYSIHLNTVFSL